MNILKNTIIILAAVMALFLGSGFANAQDTIPDIIGPVIKDTEGNPLEKACDAPGVESSFCEQIRNDASASLKCETITKGDAADCSSNPILNLLKIALQLITVVAAALAVIFFILGAIKYSASRGSPESIAAAKKMVIYSIVGLMMTMFAGSIVALFLRGI